jgi:hypothetical protein
VWAVSCEKYERFYAADRLKTFMLFILIPGLILVALMAYASTRIKKTAAAAYDAETVETDEFIIQKPEGFLHNLNGDPKYIFEAYSKDLSQVNDKFRVGTVTISRVENASLDALADELVQGGHVFDDETQKIGEHRYRFLASNRIIDDLKTEISYKLAERSGRVYKLEITALEESANDQWVEIFYDSFHIK